MCYDLPMSAGLFTISRHPQKEVAATAWVGTDTIAIAFYEVLVVSSDETFEYFLQRELRVQARPIGYPDAMPADELDERLDRWYRGDFLESSDHQEVINFPSRQVRNIPLSQMLTTAEAAFCPPTVPQQLAVPSEQDVQDLATAGILLGFRSSRDLLSRYQQLKVAVLYAHFAANGDSRPVVSVASQTLGSTDHLDVTRTRNTLQKSRESGFLTTAQHGKTGGQITQRASDFCDQLNEAIKGLRP